MKDVDYAIVMGFFEGIKEKLYEEYKIALRTSCEMEDSWCRLDIMILSSYLRIFVCHSCWEATPRGDLAIYDAGGPSTRYSKPFARWYWYKMATPDALDWAIGVVKECVSHGDPDFWRVRSPASVEPGKVLAMLHAATVAPRYPDDEFVDE